MSLKQFHNSIHSIVNNTHINRGEALLRHLGWQLRKVLNQFPYEQRISKSRILAHDRFSGVGALINSQGLYNYNNMNLLQWVLQHGTVFFDIGANIGSYALLASEIDQARVFAFEPHPKTFSRLKENIELNKRENVILFNTALGATEGEVHFTDNIRSALNHILLMPVAESISVPCIRAEQICKAYGLHPHVVKLDVEGFEFDVLQGFGEFLSFTQLLFIEINGLSDQRSQGGKTIHEFLVSEGFWGPFSCDYDQRRFLRKTQKSREDSIYMNPHFYRRTLQPNWSLDHEPEQTELRVTANSI